MGAKAKQTTDPEWTRTYRAVSERLSPFAGDTGSGLIGLLEIGLGVQKYACQSSSCLVLLPQRHIPMKLKRDLNLLPLHKTIRKNIEPRKYFKNGMVHNWKVWNNVILLFACRLQLV